MAGKVVLAHGDDWIGIYVDGQLINEGHSLDESQILDALGIDHEYREVSDFTFEEYGFRLPSKLTQVDFKDDF